jgi:sterol desaturase/sphingolipid hydroxylase (fatty acid hydroxylase superfamily)
MLNELSFHVALGITFAVDALLLGVLGWMFHQERFAKWHIRERMEMKGVSKRQYLLNIVPNSLLSTIATIGLIYGLSPWTMTTEMPAWWVMVVQGFAILFVYDFAYYGLHRFFHARQVFPLVHVVHHRARFPHAIDSLYQSPVELFSGLGLFMAVVLVIGPIHWSVFVTLFFLYSTLHIVIHSGMIFPHRAFAVINDLTMKHHRHHLNKHGHNFASVTPLPDYLFGTLA